MVFKKLSRLGSSSKRSKNKEQEKEVKAPSLREEKVAATDTSSSSSSSLKSPRNKSKHRDLREKKVTKSVTPSSSQPLQSSLSTRNNNIDDDFVLEEKKLDDDDQGVEGNDYDNELLEEEEKGMFYYKKFARQLEKEAAEEEAKKKKENGDDDDDDLDIDKHLDEVNDLIYEVEKEVIKESIEQGELPPPPPYSLREHCQSLNLKQTSDGHGEMWYVDSTSQYLSKDQQGASSDSVLKNVIQDYIQPIVIDDKNRQFQEDRIGLTSVLINSRIDSGGDSKPEPLPVRTVTMRLRPDASQELIMKSIKSVFQGNMMNHDRSLVLTDTIECYKVIGGNASGVLVCMLANIVTHKVTLERKLWLRFYHVYQLDLSKQQLELLVDIKKSIQGPQILPKRTSRQIQFVEASSAVQFMKDHKLKLKDPAPEHTKEYTSEWFQTTFEPSPSVLSVFFNDTNKCYPALAKQDYALWHTTFGIVDEIFLQISGIHHLTFDALLDPTRRFGSLWSTHNTLFDQHYAYQLAKISRQHMRTELSSHINKSASALQSTLDEYNELIDFLSDVHTKQLNIPFTKELDEVLALHCQHDSSKQVSSKFSLSKRQRNDYPWHQDCQSCLEQIAKQIEIDLDRKGTSKSQYLKQVESYVRTFLMSLISIDDSEQQLVLKEINRKGMKQIQQIQGVCKKFLEALIVMPTKYPHLPHIVQPSEDWYEFSLHSKTSNTRRNPMPIWVFKTKLGQGCITAHQLIFVTGYLTTKVDVYDWTDIELEYTPKNLLTKINVLDCHNSSNNKNQVVCGFYPRSDRSTTAVTTDDGDAFCAKLVRICRTIKALQEA